MDDRRRLLERVYSRAGAAEVPQDYHDPSTGRLARMTPSQWALAEYDRAHPASAASEDSARHSLPVHTAADDERVVDPRETEPEGGPSADADAEHAEHPAAADHTAEHTADAPRLRRPALFALIGVVAFALGSLVTLGVQASTTPRSTVHTPTATAIDEAPPPLAGPAISEFFRSSPRADDLAASVTAGFEPNSFHPVARSITLQETASIYAARRLDGTYCLVAVKDGARAAETCATVEGISEHGLHLTKDAVRDVDGRPITVTITWERDGNISSTVEPSAG